MTLLDVARAILRPRFLNGPVSWLTQVRHIPFGSSIEGTHLWKEMLILLPVPGPGGPGMLVWKVSGKIMTINRAGAVIIEGGLLRGKVEQECDTSYRGIIVWVDKK